jgi:hypothetical protein
MREALHLLARDFDQIAMPRRGKYVPASPESTQTEQYARK